MSMRQDPKMNLIAGVFLLLGIVLTVAATFRLKNLSTEPTTTYRVALRLNTGSAGMEAQAAVRIGGQRVGRVNKVETKTRAELGADWARVEAAQEGFRQRRGVEVPSVPKTLPSGRAAPESIEDHEGRPKDYDALFGDGPIVVIEIEVPSKFEIYQDARVDLDVPLLGSGASLNIPYTGNPDAGRPPLADGDFLVGQLGSPLLLYQAGLDPEKVWEIVDNIQATSRLVREEMAPDAKDLLRSVHETWESDGRGIITDVRDVTSGARDAWPTWKGDIDHTLANARNASDRFDSTMDNVEQLTGTARDGVDAFKEGVTLARDVIQENRDNVRETIASAKRTMRDIETTTRPNVDETLDGYQALAEQAGSYLAQYKPVLDQVMANVRLASGQLRLLAIEIRAQPWRVLHRPDTKELETQLLYDSSRAYASAVSDLRAASESLEAMLDRADTGGAVDPSQLQGLNSDLQQAFERYRDAERALLDRMIEDSK